VNADSFDLSLEQSPELIACIERKELELDARAAGIDDEDGFGHRRQAWIGCFVIWLWR
jgi:hypothetical protein